MSTIEQTGKFVVERHTTGVLDYNALTEFFDPTSGKPSSQSQLAKLRPEREYTSRYETPNVQPGLVDADDADDPANRLRAIFGRLKGLEALGPNWDSYGSQSPVSFAISKADELVWAVIAQNFGRVGVRAIPYTAVPLSGGGVQLEWRGTNSSIEVEIGPNCEFGYLLTRQRVPEETEERDAVAQSEILRLIAMVVA